MLRKSNVVSEYQIALKTDLFHIQRELAEELNVPNMREGFVSFGKKATVAGFGKTSAFSSNTARVIV